MQFVRACKKSFSLVLISTLILFSLLLLPQKAFAGVNSSEGSGSAFQGSSNIELGDIYWTNFSGPSEYSNWEPTNLGAYTTWPSGGWLRWNSFFDKFSPGLWNKGQHLDPERNMDNKLIHEAFANGFSQGDIDVGTGYDAGWGGSYPIGVHWWIKGNTILDAVWIANYEVKEPETKTIMVAAFSEDPDRTHEFFLDNRNQSAEWLWSNSPDSATYTGQSALNEYDYNKRICTQRMSLSRVKHYMSAEPDKVWYTDYSKNGSSWIWKDISYDVKTPAIDQSYFKPLNLNTNTYSF